MMSTGTPKWSKPHCVWLRSEFFCTRNWPISNMLMCVMVMPSVKLLLTSHPDSVSLRPKCWIRKPWSSWVRKSESTARSWSSSWCHEVEGQMSTLPMRVQLTVAPSSWVFNSTVRHTLPLLSFPAREHNLNSNHGCILGLSGCKTWSKYTKSKKLLNWSIA